MNSTIMEIFQNSTLINNANNFGTKRTLSPLITILIQSKIIQDNNESNSTETTSTSKSNEHIDNSNSGKSLIIILAITLPTLATMAILLLVLLCYRRRHSSVWLKKIENDSQLKSIVVNLSTESDYSTKKFVKERFRHTYTNPKTETIIYNRVTDPTTPLMQNSFCRKEGTINLAFEDTPNPTLINSLSSEKLTTGDRMSTIDIDFPISIQSSVRINQTFIEAIAAHRLSLTEPYCYESSNNRSSSSSNYSDSSQIILLFSQRTEL
ncbi:unnamed protein product [Didymodactylos carnosus]|uniref:Uncharacterized protein n=2 Tax=Didymodactylos carnosus TaxID=1234261 RepID=A0A814ST31_9BILA|nr:unnamed protein product [Didymodactylos carnosus]CAF3915008.1 unnamed protein product [Didymodactylos carnosus]